MEEKKVNLRIKKKKNEEKRETPGFSNKKRERETKSTDQKEK